MLVVALAYCVYAFGGVFFVCEVTQQICDVLDNFDRVIGRLNWYMYPHGMKKMLPTILILVQRKVEIKFFGSIACDRNLLKRVSCFLQSFQFQF